MRNSRKFWLDEGKREKRIVEEWTCWFLTLRVSLIWAGGSGDRDLFDTNEAEIVAEELTIVDTDKTRPLTLTQDSLWIFMLLSREFLRLLLGFREGEKKVVKLMES